MVQMSEFARGLMAVLIFGLVLSVWSWVTSAVPGSVGGGLHFIVLLVASISGLGVYLYTA